MEKIPFKTESKQSTMQISLMEPVILFLFWYKIIFVSNTGGQ